MAGYIPKERLPAFTLWQAHDFSGSAPEAKAARDTGGAAPKTQAPRLSLPSAEAQARAAKILERMQANAEMTPVMALAAALSADALASPPPSREKTSIPLPTAEQLERIHEEAHASGYQAGFEEGKSAGFAEGRTAGYQEGSAAAAAHNERCQALAQGFQEALAEFDQAMAEAVLACALEVARQVIRGTVRTRPETLLPVIREALTSLPLQHGPVTLRVAPENLALAQEQLGAQFETAGWFIHSDPDIPPGGCRLKAGSSEVDATLTTRWQRTLAAIGADELLAQGDVAATP